ncbi:TPA: hypothetical protein N0F65_010227 [Lagenidium giganteum]|uniref:Uncharacterized protein n=1 Tax=Lagenidium giganteum TaxID=4803 RepID=A0AAV2Z166_9STRA|nr:TPA: hypothetical protein N0F65_010227 [Lagenidium giganteum]
MDPAQGSVTPSAITSWTWLQWQSLYNASVSNPRLLQQIYRQGPRIRAKILISRSVSLPEVIAGQAQFLDQLSSFLAVNADRLNVEYVETNAASEADLTAYFLSVGISALPSPVAMPTSTLQDAIDSERTRLVSVLTSGRTINGLVVGLDSIQAFGSPSVLTDTAIDGEVFYQIDFKPWVGLRLVIFSNSMLATSSVTTLRTDPYRNLRFRFFLLSQLSVLHLESSDILVRDVIPIPSDIYNEAVSLVTIEVHVNSDQYRSAVDGDLRNESAADAFSLLEPQWSIVGVDLDQAADTLIVPTLTVDAPVLGDEPHQSAFVWIQVSGLDLQSLEANPWAILDAVRNLVSQASGFNDYQITLKSAKWAQQILDPTIANSIVLVLHVRRDNNNVAISTVDSALAYTPLVAPTGGFLNYTQIIEWHGASRAPPQPLQPHIQANLTVEGPRAQALGYGTDAMLEFRLRTAMLVLLQQIQVLNDDIELIDYRPAHSRQSNSLTGLVTSATLTYQVKISQQSQRQGVSMLLLSDRFKRMVELYTLAQLQVLEVELDLHADNSQVRDRWLPGGFGHTPVAPTVFLSPPSGSLTQVYRFDAPLPEPSGQSSGTVDPQMQRSLPTCNDNTPGTAVCIALHVGTTIESHRWFLRAIESDSEIMTMSITMPPSVPVTSSTGTVSPGLPTSRMLPSPWPPSQPGPWVPLVETPSSWIFMAPPTDVSELRFVFERLPNENEGVDYEGEPSTLVVSVSNVWNSTSFPVAVTSALVAATPAGRASVSVDDVYPSPWSLDMTLVLEPYRLGGLFSTDEQPIPCQQCVDLWNQCEASVECHAIGECFQSTLRSDALLFGKVMFSDTLGGRLSLTSLMHSCLAPPWTTTARSLFLRGLSCAEGVKCPVATFVSAPGASLVLQYTPRHQTITFGLTFQCTLRFLLASTGVSRDFVGLTQQSINTTPLQDGIQALYGDNGVNVKVAVVTDPRLKTVRMDIQYAFATELPFVSAVTGAIPTIATVDTEDLVLLAKQQ